MRYCGGFKYLCFFVSFFILICCKQTYGFKIGYDSECLETNAHIMLDAMEQYWGRDIIQQKLHDGDIFFFACYIDKDGHFVGFAKSRSTFDKSEMMDFERFLKENKTFFYICIVSYPYVDENIIIKDIQRRYDNNELSIITIGVPRNLKDYNNIYNGHKSFDAVSTDTI